MSEQDKRNTMQLELTCFIWSELELREQRCPVYNQYNIGAYEMMHAVHELAVYAERRYNSFEPYTKLMCVRIVSGGGA